MQAIHKPELALGQSFLYKSTIRVNVFGRERDKDGVISYYWVVDGTGGRFKAFPNELTIGRAKAFPAFPNELTL